MMKKRCGNCEYRRKNYKDKTLECHKNPPIGHYEWPMVREDDDCGEHEFEQVKTISNTIVAARH